ncbi:MAG: S1 RNA-binding domain-containing protein [bacterium]
MTYPVGTVMEGKVVDITKFGAFVKLPGGKTGLVHISQISSDYVKEVGDYLSVGKLVHVKVAAIDDRGRIQLSIKDVKEGETENAQKFVETPESEGPGGHGRPPRRGRFRERGEESDSFERKLRSFMRQSEERLVDVKRSMDAKRGIKKKKRKR